MARIRVSTVIAAPPAQVWDEVRQVDRHVDWMADAAEIRFLSDQREGRGTSFDCLTKVGPIRLKDRMTITAWRPGRAIGVEHQGLVAGVGTFTLAGLRRGRTRFTWEEQLTFPWWLGGPVGGTIGAMVLRRIWKRNLRVLKALIEAHRA